MTSKDYEIIAEAVRKVREDSVLTLGTATEISARIEGRADILTALCQVFAQDNPRFDTARFLTACGY